MVLPLLPSGPETVRLLLVGLPLGEPVAGSGPSVKNRQVGLFDAMTRLPDRAERVGDRHARSRRRDWIECSLLGSHTPASRRRHHALSSMVCQKKDYVPARSSL